jgi:hypothetical protein
MSSPLIPANAGIQSGVLQTRVPAFAGTSGGYARPERVK